MAGGVQPSRIELPLRRVIVKPDNADAMFGRKSSLLRSGRMLAINHLVSAG